MWYLMFAIYSNKLVPYGNENDGQTKPQINLGKLIHFHSILSGVIQLTYAQP
jgi:hypothetical protein